MKKYGVFLAGLGAYASAALFLYAMTMPVSLPGANVVNIHLLHRQEQLFWLSVIGLIISVFFFIKGWRQRGTEIKQDTEELTRKGKKSFRDNFLTKRMAIIVVFGLVAYVGATIYADYKTLEQNRALLIECISNYSGSTDEGREAHEHACFLATYQR